MSRVFVHMVLWNSAATHGSYSVYKAAESVLKQVEYKLGDNLRFLISDNASSQDCCLSDLQKEFYGLGVEFRINTHNFGFSGAHNIGAYSFLQSNAEYLLILNPDCALTSDFLVRSIEALKSQKEYVIATPRLLRADQDMEAVKPAIIDACGMELTTSIRHFDRGSGEQDLGQYLKYEAVFGGTGACLLLTKEAVQKLILNDLKYTGDQERVHSDLKYLPADRVDLFDEAFFAYREDADLAWRAQLAGLKCLYVPDAVAYHRRVVTPERRDNLEPELNCHSVRNRFLLQINNYYFAKFPAALLPGIFFRNILVIFAVLFKERTSLKAWPQVFKLWRRAIERRRQIKKQYAI